MQSALIRQKFIEFFKSKDHQFVESASCVAKNDPSLMFVNAGMVPFKNIFIGTQPTKHQALTSVQRCIRAGGKHNDLENVGYTYRHHTYFEMLGNFSFGKYFKRDAIIYAWEFLTVVLKIPTEKLWITVFKDDEEAKNIWLNEIGINKKQFSECGTQDNFWSMGKIGPCGPCSEIFYDHGEHLAGNPPQDKQDTGDRYVEIWNLVFMQYDLQADGSTLPLSVPCVDTGMGLERIAGVMQKQFNNYKTDLFSPLVSEIQKHTKDSNENHASVHVIADHIRSIVFLMYDGILPTNEHAGYVLRRIIRRAIRHGYLLGIREPFLHVIAQSCIPLLSEIQPDMTEKKEQILRTLKNEERLFFQTLKQGMQLLETIMQSKNKVVDARSAFKLYDTYGFPIDLTKDIANKNHLTIDETGFQDLLNEQKERSKNRQKFLNGVTLPTQQQTQFVGNGCFSCPAVISQIWCNNQALHTLEHNQEAIVILDETVFYAESGGQIYDIGTIQTDDGVFCVSHVQNHPSGSILHVGHLQSGCLKHTLCTAIINKKRRKSITKNHTATHLLHAALRSVLGEHVTQRGSLVNEDYLRFDFSHTNALSQLQINAVEDWVNQRIEKQLPVKIEHHTLKKAKEMGAMAFFEDKYNPENVRTLTIGNNDSIELCGGTHVSNVCEIGCFCITDESSLSSGIRRIEAKTSLHAFSYVQKKAKNAQNSAEKLRTTTEQLPCAIDKLLLKNQEAFQLKKQIQAQKSEQTAQRITKQKQTIQWQGKKITWIQEQLSNRTLDELKRISDPLQSDDCLLILSSVKDEKAFLFIYVGKEIQSIVSAKQLIQHAVDKKLFKGGGNAQKIQGYFLNGSEGLKYYLSYLKKNFQQVS